MAAEKSMGPNGIDVKFYTKFWPLIGLEFTAMIQVSLQKGTLPIGMNRGLIVLHFKSGECKDLSNWRIISLLNTSYKFMAKVLQRRLQPLLSDIISSDQTAFLPTHYVILDNILLQHEMTEWASESAQDLILPKFNFRKAYDSVSLPFLFHTMQALGVLVELMAIVQLFFTNVEATVKLNSGKSEIFQVNRASGRDAS